MKIQTGQGTIPLITLIGIFSISALNALPGLAVSPILGDLNKIFPSATDLEIQMLSSLPSLLIIPFILLSGKLTEKVNNLLLLQVGLTIFGVSGILYLLSGKMWQLIAISAMLGIGSGLIVPLSTGLISRYFVGSYRTRQFGYSSAITNITLVLATTLTGYLAEVNWHLPFLVYLFPFISIFLTCYLKKDLSGYHPKDDVPASTVKEMGKRGIDVKALVKLMAFYGLATYLVIIVSFNLPFLMEEYGLSSGRAGILISLFFLAIMAPGFVLNKIVQMLGRRIYMICLLLIACGMGIILVSRSEILIALGCIGGGYPPTPPTGNFSVFRYTCKTYYNVRGSSIYVLYSSAAICLSVSICSINSAFDKSATVRKSWEYTPVSSLTRSTYIIGENSRKRRSVCSSVRRSPASQIACLNVGTT